MTKQRVLITGHHKKKRGENMIFAFKTKITVGEFRFLMIDTTTKDGFINTSNPSNCSKNYLKNFSTLNKGDFDYYYQQALQDKYNIVSI